MVLHKFYFIVQVFFLNSIGPKKEIHYIYFLDLTEWEANEDHSIFAFYFY